MAVTRSQNDASDDELLERFSAGESTAFVDFVERNHDAVWRFVRHSIGARSEVDDIVQETFMEAMTSASRFSGAGSPRAWLLGIARHRIARQFRRRVHEPEYFEPLEELGLRAGWGDPEAAAVHREAAAHLKQAMDRLPPEAQQLLLLRDVEGFTNEESAQILDITLAATKSRLHRARLMLLAELRHLAGDRDD